jgi:hypothetical protein
LFVNTLRGWDATGISGIRETGYGNKKQNVVHTFKKALNYIDYIETRGARRFMDKFSDFYYVIGHVRASTRGAGDDMNAHPFTYGHITLCHNGTVNEFPLNVQTDESVDSAKIAAYMAEHGAKATFPKLDGGFSLVWYDGKDDTLNLARNRHKPMAVAFVKDKNEMYYGSEYFMLWATLKRAGIEIDGPISVTRPDYHYKFNKEDLRAFEMVKFEPFTRPQAPVSQWQGESATVHQPKQTGTSSGANATSAGASSKSTTTTSTAITSLTTKSLSPPVERIVQCNRILELKGQKCGDSLVLKPKQWRKYENSKTKEGRLVLTSFDEEDDDIYVIYGVPDAVSARWFEVGKVACKIRNIASLSDAILTIICEHNPEMQLILEGSQEVIVLADSNPKPTIVTEKSEWCEATMTWISKKKEGSKSPNEEIAGVSIDTTTGEISELPSEEERRDLPGPNGQKLTKREFLEYAKHGCNYCTNSIDTSFPHFVGWNNGEIICHKCKNDPTVQMELTSGYMGGVH